MQDPSVQVTISRRKDSTCSSASESSESENYHLYIVEKDEDEGESESCESQTASSSRRKRKQSAVEASGKLDFGELELELWDSRYMIRGVKERSPCEGWCKPSCIPITIILILIVLVVVLSLLDQNHIENAHREQLKLKNEWITCRNSCQIELLESIPEGLVFNSSIKHGSTHDGWVRLLEMAKHTIEIGSFYWNLVDPTLAPEYTEKGQDIYDRLLEAGTNRSISVRIAQNSPSDLFPNFDTKNLAEAKAAEVRSLNFSRLMGGGILHTKMWVVDRKHVYIGSANFDWRSLTQVKELGILVTDCSCFAKDLGKVFDVYWKLGEKDAKIPEKWPSAMSTTYNMQNPMDIAFNGIDYFSFISSAPAPFNPNGRTFDLDAILDVIQNATEFIHISVMDYAPLIEFNHPEKFWPEIDDALRSAAIDSGVKVKLLISQWPHTKNSTYHFLQSLVDLNNALHHVDIQVKLFVVPATPAQKEIPFARVNHNKYMVTEKTAFIGTSNWSGDYFTDTAGVGFIVTPQNDTSSASKSNGPEIDLRTQVAQIFERDWNSEFAKDFNLHGSQ